MKEYCFREEPFEIYGVPLFKKSRYAGKASCLGARKASFFKGPWPALPGGKTSFPHKFEKNKSLRKI